MYKISEVDGLVDIFRFGVPVCGDRHVQGSLPQERLAVRRHIRQVVHHYEHLHYRLIRVEQRLEDKLSGTYFYPTWHVDKTMKVGVKIYAQNMNTLFKNIIPRIWIVKQFLLSFILLQQ